MSSSKRITEKSLIRKVSESFSAAGHEAIYSALVLYYTLESPNTPAWCKTAVLGSLGYFISLIDGIPDLTPLLGYTDDAAVMAATVATISAHITSDIKDKAKARHGRLFHRDGNKTDEQESTPPKT